MEHRLSLALHAAFQEEAFLQKLTLSPEELSTMLNGMDWDAADGLLPIRQRLSCADVLPLFRPLMEQIAPEPEGGWLPHTYRVAVSLLYPRGEEPSPARDAALCLLQGLQVLLDAERQALPFDPFMDFAFCTPAELKDSGAAEEYRLFLRHFREDYIYEMLRLGREVTPFLTLEHIAGVHHVAMSVSRAFKASGGLIDLGVMSGAAAAHDLGKFGCRPGERVPYLHYFYTDLWCQQTNLPTIGRIAANHSVWDLEIENLSSESLVLVYADFRMKQTRDEAGREIPQIFSLRDAFSVILSKLDNVDTTKRRRYEFVYAKLLDFEEYLVYSGVDTTLATPGLPPLPDRDPALLDQPEVVRTLRHTAVDHNIRLMHRLGHERLFAGILEAARGEKDPDRIRAYVSIFEEYFTYWSIVQKEQTLEFLYDLLLIPDGDVRRRAASLMGRILARFLSGYKKELPADVPPSPTEARPFELWSEYLDRLIQPDHRLTVRQTSMIRYQAKIVTDSLLSACSPADLPRFTELLFCHFRAPEAKDPDAAFTLLDTVLNLPLERLSAEEITLLTDFALWWLANGAAPQKAAALRLFRSLLSALPEGHAARERMLEAIVRADCSGSVPLLFLQAELCHQFRLRDNILWRQLDENETVSNVFLDNLKTATPWILKAVGVEYLLNQAQYNRSANLLHIATHFSNLIKVSENVVVRRMAGSALLTIAPMLTPDRRNEVAVELAKALETGQAEISRYIPEYLGRFMLWLSPRELDELLDHILHLLSSSNDNVVAVALATVGATLEHYAEYGPRFGESDDILETRQRRMAGLLLKGLASCQERTRQESLRILSEHIFASGVLDDERKTHLFTLTAKKILFLMEKEHDQELTFFYTAAALSHIYRFIVRHRIEYGPFRFKTPGKVAFFPGTFDPFSLSHKGIVQAIRDLGFEVYLAIDEFSWSKKAQPSLMRRQIVSMSVADEFDVYLFPHNLPVNLATPDDLQRLRKVFSGRELYLAVGSDVIANASSYKAAPVPGSVHHLNHIVFRRSSDAEGREFDVDLSIIRGKVIQLQLPTHLEHISSTRIRENIDLGRDISNLIDPTVQDFIFRNSLYLREPQYKQILPAGHLEFTLLEHPTREEWEELCASVAGTAQPDFSDSVCVLRDNRDNRVLGFLSLRTVTSTQLYDVLGSDDLAHYVRSHTAGHIRMLTGMRIAPDAGTLDIGQLLLTEVLSRAMAEDCSYALWWSPSPPDTTLDLLERQGFTPAEIETPRPLLLVDMRSPVVLLQNIPTTLKAPFSSHPQVLAAIQEAHFRLQHAICGMYPGTLVLSVNAEVIYHRLVRKITELNGVPAEPLVPRKLGPKMCVPFGKILRGNVVPNTVTKTLHTDKVFAQDLRSHTIGPYPGYAPLESQLRMVRSFRRPVILVDDLMHSSFRLRTLDPMFRKEGLEIDQVLVGFLSGRGRDLAAALGRKVDCVYSVPNLQAWFVESTIYPFIGGDTLGGSDGNVPGLTPGVNLILPYALPRFYKDRNRKAVFQFSKTCLENSRNILLALENAYREQYARNLTLSHLSEAIILPLAPDKGDTLHYDPNLSASACLDNDLKMLLRMRELLD